MVVVQSEERNMYDQHWQSSVLREKYPLLILFLRFPGLHLNSSYYLCYTKRSSSLASKHAQYRNYQEDSS